MNQELELFNKNEDKPIVPMMKSEFTSNKQGDVQSTHRNEIQCIDSERQPFKCDSAAIDPNFKSPLKLKKQQSQQLESNLKTQNLQNLNRVLETSNKSPTSNQIEDNSALQDRRLEEDDLDFEANLDCLQRLALKYTGEPNVWALY